ncbi:MAG: universal stress protein [Gemmatimonadota bacterium]|nr:universal stress protein [Gemmatimonadota bacterium]
MLRTILVPLDGSPLAERALAIGCDLARRAGGAVHLVRSHVPIGVIGATGEGAILSPDLLAADEVLRNKAEEYLKAQAARLAREWGLSVTPHIADGGPSGYITEVAELVNADLIVMTTHGAGGFTPGWLGSVTDAVIRHSHRPVLALPEHDAHAGEPFTPRTLLVTLDGSQHADAIIPAARDLAITFGASVSFVRVIAPFIPGDVVSTMMADRPDPFGIDSQVAAAKLELDALVATMQASGIEATSTVEVSSAPTRHLLEHIKQTEPDCLAIATQGRGLSRLFLGSVADKLIRSAGHPVLVLRPRT